MGAARAIGFDLLTAAVRDGFPEVAGTRLTPPPGSALAEGAKVVAGIRPEYLRPAAEGITGTVSVVETLGVTSLVTPECPGDVLVGPTVPEDEEPAVGTAMTVAPAPGRLLVYDVATGLLAA